MNDLDYADCCPLTARYIEFRLCTSAADRASYDAWVKHHPQGSLWQSLEWQTYQKALGRETRIYAATEGDNVLATALVVIDRTSFRLSAWDIPRGPLWTDAVMALKLVAHIRREAAHDRCLRLTYSPAAALPGTVSGSRDSDRHEQPEATRIVDIAQSDEQILAQMHQKGRYNIRVAEKHGIVIEQSRDTDSYAALAHETAARDKFRAASKLQYETFVEHLPGSFLLLAKAPDISKPVAGLLGVTWNGTGIYYYGASDYEHRALMAPYLLQWETMKFCRKAGCSRYDLLGVAPQDSDEDHPWRGISGFKEKFGGMLVTYTPERQITVKPVAYTLLNLKRKIFG